MHTMKERFEFLNETIQDPDHQVTLFEGFRHLYYLVRFELASIKIEKQRDIRNRYMEKLNNDLTVFRLRRDMKDL